MSSSIHNETLFFILLTWDFAFLRTSGSKQRVVRTLFFVPMSFGPVLFRAAGVVVLWVAIQYMHNNYG
jgi:hypothetical protein